MTRSIRARILATAATALSAALSTQALAADASIVTQPLVSGPPVSGFTSVLTGSVVSGDGTPQINQATGNVNASVTSSTITTTLVGNGSGSFTNSSNSADSVASANRNGASISLGTISSGAFDGIAIGTVSANLAAITSTVSGLDAGGSLTGVISGSVTVASNSIDATTIINDGSSIIPATSSSPVNDLRAIISGAAPVGYSNTAGGSASTQTNNLTSVTTTQGTLAVANAQVTSGANSSATASGNDVFLTLDSTAASTVTGSAVLDANNIGASFTGNTRTAIIGVASETASFGGTAVIGNSQTFDGNADDSVPATNDANAVNSDSSIAATVAGTAGNLNQLSGSLTVNDNAITSAANGNVLSGSITLANSLSYDGADAANVASASGSVSLVRTSGDLVIGSEQRSLTGATAAFLSAATSDASITADVQQPFNSTSSTPASVTLSGNDVTSVATNNSMSTAIRSGTGSALFDGSVALGNNQLVGFNPTLGAFATTAEVTGSNLAVTVGATDGVVSGSSVAMNANVVAAAATGNQAAQTIDLRATDIVTDTGSAVAGITISPTTGLSGSVDGAVVIGNSQLLAKAPVSADSTGTTITLTSQDKDAISAGSALSVTNNIQQAFAMGSTASANLGMTGTSVDSEAGINNVQVNAAGSTVIATQTGTVLLDVEGNAGSPTSAKPSLALTGNRSEALATGVSASNSLSVTATTAAISAIGVNDDNGIQNVSGTVAAGALTIDTQAAYAALSFQQVDANVTASASPLAGQAAFAVNVGTSTAPADTTGDVEAASVANNSNTLLAQGRAAVANNSIALNIGTIDIVGLTETAPVASVMNLQAVNASVSATAAPNGASAVVLTRILDDAAAPSISTSSNSIAAFASGAVSTNSVSAGGTNLSVFDGTGGNAGLASVNATVPSTSVTTNAAFSVVNAQANGADAGPLSVTATLRQEVSDPAAATDSALILTDIGGQVSSSGVVSNSNQLTALASSLGSTNTLSLGGANTTTLQTTGALLNLQDTRAEVSATIGYAGPPAVTSAGGVIVAIGDNIGSSSISVALNEVTGQALGNTARNTLSVRATNVLADGANTEAGAEGDLVPSTLEAIADADFALSNAQSARSDSSSTATVFSTFAIDQAPDKSITDSTLAVDGNSQVAEAMANNATNALSVTGTNLGDVTAALANTQGMGIASAVSASSGLEAFANVQSADSTISIDGNSNRAIGVFNNASNTLSVSATNIDGIAVNATAALADATGTFALSNVQSTTTVVDPQATRPTLNTTATTSIFNNDAVDTASTGIVGGLVSMANNLTSAESSANRASNSLSVVGSAGNAAPAALSNDQNSTATVSASANATIRNSLAGTAGDPASAAANGSSVLVAGNATEALARGNTATNSMVFNAGADFGPAAGAAVTTGAAGTASAAAAMLNNQANSGEVTAEATASYGVVLNGGGTPATANAAVLNSAVSVSGNTVVAGAFGNQATNRMELAVLNSGNATAAFNNNQVNNGVITARANSVSFTSSVNGTVTNGAFRNVGNAIGSTAVGNSSVTAIIGR